MSRVGRWVLRGTGGALVGGGLGGAYAYSWAKSTMGEEAVGRLLDFYEVALPATCEYKWLEAKCESLPKVAPFLFPPVTDEEELAQFQVLHRKWAKPTFDKCMKLGGFYYKNGQKIASNQGGIFPKFYQDLFQPFLNDLPPRPFAEVKATLEEELGGPVESVFQSVTETPVGVASIGQAHRAQLKDGTRVIVKVQNPTAERYFRGDVFALKTLMDIFMPQLSPAFDEMEKQFATEFDYRGEAKNGTDVRANLAKAGWLDKNILVPKNHDKYCTRRVMVMEEIHPSIPLHTALERQLEALARQRGMSKEAIIEEETQKIEAEAKEAALTGKLQRTLSSGTYDKFIALQRSKRGVLKLWALTFNYTIGLGLPRSWKYDMSVVADDVMVPINAARLVDDLMAVHGHEVLVDGAFNTDPHPGNILYVDSGQKLGLIDYGQVKRLTRDQRLEVCRTFVLIEAAMKLDPRANPKVDMAKHAKAKAAIVKRFQALGFETEKMDPEVHYEMATVFMGRMDRTWIYPRNLPQWSDDLQARDPMGDLKKVDYFIMINVATMMLRGLGEMLRQPRDLAKSWGPIAREALKKEGLLAPLDAEIKSWNE